MLPKLMTEIIPNEPVTVWYCIMSLLSGKKKKCLIENIHFVNNPIQNSKIWYGEITDKLL